MNLIKRIKNCKGCRRRRQWIYRWLAKNRLIRRYEYINEVNKILEQYNTHNILGGGSQEFISKCRSELNKLRGEVAENEKFVQFLRNL